MVGGVQLCPYESGSEVQTTLCVPISQRPHVVRLGGSMGRGRRDVSHVQPWPVTQPM